MKESNRVYNFSAGPSMLPLPVLEQAAEEMVNYRDFRHVRHGNEPPLKGI